ncbi:MAG: carboxymuconolactone decarboxylase family protein [Gammaproteobacteria bacterium]
MAETDLFEVHSLDTAPAASKSLLKHSQELYGGMIPNLHGVMAESPALLEAYQQLNELVKKMALDMIEVNIVWLAINHQNGCTYCMAAHTAVAMHGGVSQADINALREGNQLADPKHQALRIFTEVMIEQRGWADDKAISELLAACYTKQSLLDVILCIGMKTLSNYTNHVAHTPVDKAFEKFTWQNPERIL